MEDKGENRMGNAVAILKKGEGRSLKAGGPWIYDNEIESIMEALRTETLCWSMTLTDILWARDLSI